MRAHKNALGLLTFFEGLLVRVVVRDESDAVIFIVVNRVVVHVSGKAHDEEGLLTLAKEEDANRSVSRLADVDHVLIRVDTHPIAVEKEIDCRKVIVALAHDVAIC